MGDLTDIRRRWLQAARIYYLSAGEDSGLSDHAWDHMGRELFARRDELPGCPVLHHPEYQGGSLFWVNDALYESALSINPTEKAL